jgi:hypothetical protein
MSTTESIAEPDDLVLETAPLTRRRWFRLAVTFLFLMLFGAIRLPFEVKLNQEHRAAFFHGANLNLSLRQQIGQMSFLAALGGFRAVIADGLFIMAHVDWTHTEWGKMLFLYNNVTALQPRNIMFWDTASWQMAYNASAFYLNDPREPHEALRLKRQHDYFLIGEDFAKRGVQNNPDRYNLYERLGMIYRDKLFDHYNAALQFAAAAKIANAPTYEVRFAAYELSYVPGHEREAYNELVRLYKMGEKEWLPTLLSRIKELQETLNIPQAQRINIPENLLPPHH